MSGLLKPLLILCALLAGCRTTGATGPANEEAFPGTGVKLTHVALAFPGETEGTVEFHLKVESPQGNAARLEALRFELFLSGRHFASGTKRLSVPMAPATVETLEVKVPLLLPRQRMLQGAQPLQVEVRGSLSVYEGGSPDPWFFAWRGKVVSDGAPDFSDEQVWED